MSRTFWKRGKKYLLTSRSFSRIIRTMKKYVKKPWSMRERTLLRDNYYIVEKEKLLELLPQRTMQSITSQVYYLKKRGWYFNHGTNN